MLDFFNKRLLHPLNLTNWGYSFLHYFKLITWPNSAESLTYLLTTYKALLSPASDAQNFQKAVSVMRSIARETCACISSIVMQLWYNQKYKQEGGSETKLQTTKIYLEAAKVLRAEHSEAFIIFSNHFRTKHSLFESQVFSPAIKTGTLQCRSDYPLLSGCRGNTRTVLAAHRSYTGPVNANCKSFDRQDVLQPDRVHWTQISST